MLKKKEKQNVLNEDFCQESIIKWLEKKGFIISDKYKKKSKYKRGIDIIAQNKNGIQYNIEVKGISRALKVDFECALGQIILQMSDRRTSAQNRFYLGFPEKIYDKYINQISKIVAKKLKLRLLIVDKKGMVKEENLF